MPKGLTVVLNQPGKPLALETLPTPEIEPGGILIRNTAAAICGSDLHYWRNDGDYKGPDLRRVPGHEFTGVVHSLGRGVETDSLRRPLREGDRVAFPFFNPCNRCYWCVRGEHHACPHRCGIGSWGLLGGQRLSMGDYVTGTGSTDGVTAPPERASVGYSHLRAVTDRRDHTRPIARGRAPRRRAPGARWAGTARSPILAAARTSTSGWRR